MISRLLMPALAAALKVYGLDALFGVAFVVMGVGVHLLFGAGGTWLFAGLVLFLIALALGWSTSHKPQAPR